VYVVIETVNVYTLCRHAAALIVIIICIVFVSLVQHFNQLNEKTNYIHPPLGKNLFTFLDTDVSWVSLDG
jgi:flagellar biosynthesis protein FliQ